MNVAEQLRTALAGRYEIEGEIGVGGMATVYRAVDLRHQRKVAVKVLHTELAAVLGSERFLKEIELTAGLQHPHILPLFDSGEAEGLLYYVMPYVEGESLRARLERERQLPVAEALRMAAEVADALDYSHRRGLVHRDIKPENILLHEGRTLVADFGIALAVQHSGAERMTQTGLSLGTPQYMAPEQAMGERGVDARADVYALGAVIYEMLAGEAPFTGPSSPAVLSRVLTERPRSLRTQRSSVPEQVEAAVLTALEKLPADRWQTARELAEALSGNQAASLPAASRADPGTGSGASTAPRPGVPGSQRARERAARWLLPGAAAAVLLALAVATGWLAGSRGTPAGDHAVRFQFVPPQEEGVVGPPFPPTLLAFAPDGGAFVYRAGPAGGSLGQSQLYYRRINEAVSRVVPGSVGASAPAFSPDGRAIAFTVGAVELRAWSVDGGAPVRIASLSGVRGVAWVGKTIVLGNPSVGGGLMSLPASGGVPEPLTLPDGAQGPVSHIAPIALPGGETVLFQVVDPSSQSSRIGVASIRNGDYSLLDVHAFRTASRAGSSSTASSRALEVHCQCSGFRSTQGGGGSQGARSRSSTRW
jgi:eukaryotic-like serine/threonine-protein kinase